MKTTLRVYKLEQVDSLGVRTTAIFSCALCAISRTVVVFGRSTASLYIAMLVLSPAGDGTFNPCFTVGLKKCTTDVTRPFAYALAYTVSNLGGAFSANLMDVVGLNDFGYSETTKEREMPFGW
jgi:dipeptide/tripeptide permease